MQYSRRNYNVVDFYAPTPYASSDHDPVLIGIKDAAAALPAPVVTSYQSCTSFGFKVADAQSGDKLRIEGTWNGQKQLTTVAVTEAGWWNETTMDTRGTRALIVGTGLAAVMVPLQKTECKPVVTSYQNTTSFGFKVSPFQKGDKLLVTGTWNGQKQSTTVSVTKAGWYSGSKRGWKNASAVVAEAAGA